MKVQFLDPLDFADLWFALIVMLVISVSLFLFSCWFVRKLQLKGGLIFASGVTLCIVLFGKFLLDSRWILFVMPFQAAVIYSNFLPLLSALLIGVIWQSKNIPRWRRIILVTAVIILAFRVSFNIITVQTPDCWEVWDEQVCLQTSQSTCSAAAAATLLEHYGIKSSEGEMARLSLTGEWGTCLHGLYRGLRIKTKKTPFHVSVRAADVDNLQNKVTLPVILNVRLDKRVAEKDPRYANEWGWQLGVIHTVVLFRFAENGLVEIGDPGTGREFWDIQALQDLWYGEYISLESSP